MPHPQRNMALLVIIDYVGFMVVDDPLIRCCVSWVALRGTLTFPSHSFLVDCGLRLPDTILTLAALKNIPKDV